MRLSRRPSESEESAHLLAQHVRNESTGSTAVFELRPLSPESDDTVIEIDVPEAVFNTIGYGVSPGNNNNEVHEHNAEPDEAARDKSDYDDASSIESFAEMQRMPKAAPSHRCVL